jgi:hypothetical protein
MSAATFRRGQHVIWQRVIPGTSWTRPLAATVITQTATRVWIYTTLRGYLVRRVVRPGSLRGGK